MNKLSFAKYNLMIALIVFLLCLMMVILVVCANQHEQSEDVAVNPVEIDMSQPGIRHLDDLKQMEYFTDDYAYCLYSYVAPEKAKKMKIVSRQYVDGAESDNFFGIMTVEDLELKNKAGYIGILKNHDDNYTVKVTNSANTGSKLWNGDITIDSKLIDGEESTYLNNDYECVVGEEYVLYCHAIYDEDKHYEGDVTEEIISKSKAANFIIATFE